MTLSEIRKLIEIHHGNVHVIRGGDGDPGQNIINNLVSERLIEMIPDMVCVGSDLWVATERGRLLLMWITDVPLPVQIWVDPRKASK